MDEEATKMLADVCLPIGTKLELLAQYGADAARFSVSTALEKLSDGIDEAVEEYQEELDHADCD